jgi:hypothetical protein
VVAADLAMKASVFSHEEHRHTRVPSSRSTMAPFVVFQPQVPHVRLWFSVMSTT